MSNEEILRSDARANRDRILAVARKALVEDAAASLNSIAKAAGVGAGTLYRHFSTRESLVLSVYQKEIDDLVALAPTLLAKQPPLKAFITWCAQLARFGQMKHGIADVIHGAQTDQDIHETYQQILGAVCMLMSACEQSGDVRPGANAEDFLVLVGLLWRIPPNTIGKARIKRILTLAFRGLGANVSD